METQSATSNGVFGDYLTPRQTSQLLKVPETTLSVWRCTNRVILPFFKLGHHVRYRRSDLEQFIERNLRNAASEGAR
jgi:excisionase family DNA binding protein